MIDFTKEINYKTSRSGGKGGQNVNKVETKVEALWNPSLTHIFNEEDKLFLLEKLTHKINKEGYISCQSSATRSQLENKNKATIALLHLIQKTLLKPKQRKQTKPSKAAIAKRLETKKKEGMKKETRKRIDLF